MKNRVILLASFLFVIAGCSPEQCIDCEPHTFKDTYLKYFPNNEFFFIKGIALDVNKHGREIKIVEDLKGNLMGVSSIFVWGGSNTSFCGKKEQVDGRMDRITQYNCNDTLIMFIQKATKRFSRDAERLSDYATLQCYPSVLKLSNGYVNGYINSWGETMLWKELQKELEELLNLNK